MNSPIVSVIIPVFNGEKYLRQALDCICNQTLENIEIIVVDDGSTDRTPDILREYSARDSRILLLQQNHEYAGAARHKGMSVAKGKYFSFLDADDLFEPTMLEKMVNRAEEENAEVVICRSQIFYEENVFKPLSWAFKETCIEGANLRCFNFKNEFSDVAFQTILGWPWDKLFLRSYVEQHGFTYGPTRHGNDGPFVFPATFSAERISFIDEPLVKYRQMGNQISSGSNLSKNPTAGCESVERIFSSMKSQNLPKGVWLSFYAWVTTYLRWNMKKMDAESRKSLKKYIVNQFEPKFQLLPNFINSADDKARRGMQHEKHDDVMWYKNLVSPSISVIVPVYNAALYLKEALDSLLQQTYRDFEVICVNDGSTDNSLSILNHYAENDDRFIIIDVPNGGYGKAMNLGLNTARGKYFAILEPDDYLPPKAYEKLVYLAESNDLEIVRGKFCRFYTDSKSRRRFKAEPDYNHTNVVLAPRDYPEYFYNMSMATWTCLYKRSFLVENSINYHESPGASYQDTGFFMQSFGYAERVMFSNETVYMYRTDNTESSTNNKSAKANAMQQEFAFIKEQFLSRPERWDKLQELFLLRRMAAHRWMYNNIPESALQEYLYSFREELKELCDVSRDKLLPIDVKHCEQLLISPEYFLRNVGKPKLISSDREKGDNIKKQRRELSELKQKYRFHRFLSWVTFGKTKKFHDAEYRKIKQMTRELRNSVHDNS